MIEKGKKVAPTVEKTTQKPKAETAEVVSTEQTEEVPVKPVLFDIAELGEEKIEQAEALGIPLRKIASVMNTYVQTVEARFEIIAQKMPTETDMKNAMAQAILDAQKKQREAYAEGVRTGKIEPQGQGGGGMTVMDALKIFGGGGGGQDPELAALTKDILRESLNALRSKSDWTDKFMGAVVSNIAAKEAKHLTEKLTH